MRISLIIAVLAAIAVGMVHIRRRETRANYRIQQLQLEQIYLRRKLYDQQADLGWLVSPGQVRKRMEQMSLRLTDRVISPPRVAQRLAAESSEVR